MSRDSAAPRVLPGSRSETRASAVDARVFVDGCEVCSKIPDVQDVHGEGEGFGGLVLIASRDDPEAAATVTLTELCCPHCETYYLRYRYFDDADVPASLPTRDELLMRRCPASTIETLRALGESARLERYEDSVPARVEHFARVLWDERPGDNLLPHMVKALLDAGRASAIPPYAATTTISVFKRRARAYPPSV